MREIGISNHSTHALSNILANSDKISHLDLSKNKLGSKGFKSLMPGLIKNTSIVSLNLGCNDIFGDDASDNLFEKLIHHKSLVSLNLSNTNGLNGNGISWNGCIGLSKLLSSNPIIQMINIADNGVGNKGLKILSKVSLINLTYLNLENNNITSKSLPYLKILLG